MIRRLFLDHPDSVGESYAEHFGVAAGFGLTMIAGGLACLVHAVVPAVFQRTGSQTIATLNARLVAKREAKRAAQTEMKTVDYVI
ncbi:MULTISPECIES: DUF6356 family protein [unclassified Sphingomonas]|jgi:hypothetical protein|uniref:DUF6356 family protein n=1 Tax=unclassified Sphingomonas TaxID=196159 RepID=UPI0008308975|nr:MULTISPECIES: DUF6356 family protein [unclassified Sphingomonas]MCH4891906.1 hypothetical protein [Sphingomonas sp. SFZ2018-12]